MRGSGTRVEQLSRVLMGGIARSKWRQCVLHRLRVASAVAGEGAGRVGDGRGEKVRLNEPERGRGVGCVASTRLDTTPSGRQTAYWAGFVA